MYHSKTCVALSDAMATFSISSISGSKSGSGTTESGGIIKGGGAWAFINTRGPLPTFNLIVKKNYELQWNYKGVKIEKLQSL
jgi:hypothetical protein